MTHVTLTLGGRRYKASLNKDLTWSCTDPDMEAFLNSAFSADRYPTGPDGPAVPGGAQLYALEREFKAKVAWPKPMPTVKGRVY